MTVRIRIATEADAEALLDIYAYYVTMTAVSFEEQPPSAADFRERIRRTLARYPYLVAEKDGTPVGYAYAGPFHARSAYRWAVETTIYVRRDQRRTGVGAALYGALEQALAMQNILNLNACISVPRVEDPYLGHDSPRFHARCGYRLVGEFHSCGYKFGRWYNMIWMEKTLAEHPGQPPEVLPFPAIQDRWASRDGRPARKD